MQDLTLIVFYYFRKTYTSIVSGSNLVIHFRRKETPHISVNCRNNLIWSIWRSVRETQNEKTKGVKVHNSKKMIYVVNHTLEKTSVSFPNTRSVLFVCLQEGSTKTSEKNKDQNHITPISTSPSHQHLNYYKE